MCFYSRKYTLHLKVYSKINHCREKEQKVPVKEPKVHVREKKVPVREQKVPVREQKVPVNS